MSLSSCNLDEMPTTSIGTTDDSEEIVNAENIGNFENGIYTSFRGCLYGSASEVPELMCDGFNATVGYGNNFGPCHRTDASFTSSDYDTEALWENNYSAIKNYNVFLTEVAKYTPADDDAKAEATIATGEAYFFRAYSYLTLVRHFAKAYKASTASSDLGVPLVLVYNQEEKPARATVQAVYDQIKKDLDEAASCLATVDGMTVASATAAGDNKATPVSIDAVNALYARYYIDINDNANAIIYAEKVINSDAGYSLASSAAEMKSEYSNDNGTEAVLQLAATLTENGSGTNNVYTETDYYSAWAKYSKHGGIYFQSYYLPSQKLLNLYEDNDLRLNQWFAYDYLTYLGGGLFRDEFYTFIKYLGNSDLTSTGVPNSRQHVKPLMIGEMYLIDAEANFNLNKTAEAKVALNTIQKARGTSETEATKLNIENEWFKETVGEGLRYSCMKRWGEGYNGREAQPGAVKEALLQEGQSYATKSMAADDIHWLYPIPSYEMRVNDNLVQNPGY